MSRFIIFWSLISPGCFTLVVVLHWFYSFFFKSSWFPGHPDFIISIATYLIYWLLLGILQGLLLFWKFQNRQFAYRWFFITSTTGFIVMLLHDIFLISLNSNRGGQGILILLFSLPCLAVLGGLILGLAQFSLIRKRYRVDKRFNRLVKIWIAISFFSWTIGFAGILFTFNIYTMYICIICVMGGSAIERVVYS